MSSAVVKDPPTETSLPEIASAYTRSFKPLFVNRLSQLSLQTPAGNEAFGSFAAKHGAPSFVYLSLKPRGLKLPFTPCFRVPSAFKAAASDGVPWLSGGIVAFSSGEKNGFPSPAFTAVAGWPAPARELNVRAAETGISCQKAALPSSANTNRGAAQVQAWRNRRRKPAAAERRVGSVERLRVRITRSSPCPRTLQFSALSARD